MKATTMGVWCWYRIKIERQSLMEMRQVTPSNIDANILSEVVFYLLIFKVILSQGLYLTDSTIVDHFVFLP